MNERPSYQEFKQFLLQFHPGNGKRSRQELRKMYRDFLKQLKRKPKNT